MRPVAVVLLWFVMMFLLGVGLALLFPSKVISLRQDEWACTRTEKPAPQKGEEHCVVYERKGWR